MKGLRNFKPGPYRGKWVEIEGFTSKGLIVVDKGVNPMIGSPKHFNPTMFRTFKLNHEEMQKFVASQLDLSLVDDDDEEIDK
ncbi:MAG: hypothetical protein CMC82_09805 [Flavobacteriaceae bacterium]|nr:hypothetical protein [Flavobacteriaceae bacterium]